MFRVSCCSAGTHRYSSRMRSFSTIASGKPWPARLKKLAESSDLDATILAAAPSVLARYSWANAAQQTLDAIEAAGR